MKVPDSTNPTWFKLISGAIRPEVRFLATKILLNKLNKNYRTDPSPVITKCSIYELIRLFEINIRIPKVKDDLISIFGEEEL